MAIGTSTRKTRAGRGADSGRDSDRAVTASQWRWTLALSEKQPKRPLLNPLEDGKAATIPYPMSEQTWDLFMQTLSLWKPRLVAEERSED